MGIKASNQITLMNIDLAADMPEELANLETRVTNAETSISQNKSEIELRATKTEVDTALNATNETISELAVTARGVDITSEDSNGKLVSFIGNRNGSGVWESKYTVGSNVVSGLYFDFANSQFVFDGSIVGGSININDRFIVDSSGNVTLPDNASISWSQVSSKPTNLATTDYVISQGYQTSSQVESAITNKGYQTESQVTTITKNTITTSYINTLKITAGSVAAENITGTTISGKTISGGTVSGSTITGGSININNGTFKVTSSGALTATSATITGTISGSTVSGSTISGGSISGTTISGTTISGGTVSGSTITGGSINIGSGTFTVSSAGALTATSANISGVLKAGQGSSIAGFSVDENSIYSGSWGSTGPSVFMGTGTSGSYTIGGTKTTGWVFGAGGKFGVTKTGGMYCSGGRIGGWNVGSITAIDGDTTLYSGMALYSDSYVETDTSYSMFKGATVSVALTPKYLIIYGTDADGEDIAMANRWTVILGKTYIG